MLNLTLSLPQRTFGLDDDVPLTVILHNQGSAPQLVNARLALNAPTAPAAFRELTLRVAHAGGELLALNVRINLGAPREGDFRLLEPGQQVEKHLQLRSYYALRAGSYTLQAIYQSQQAFTRGELSAWRGEVVSDAIAFEVVSA